MAVVNIINQSNQFIKIEKNGIIKERHLKDELDSKEIQKNKTSVDISKKLKKYKYGEFNDFEKYEPEFAKSDTNKGFYDHGYCSFLIGSEVMRLYDEIINYCNNNTDEKSTLIKLGVGLNSYTDINAQIHECEEMFNTAMFAVITHNIYPRYFKNNFRSDLEKTPFNYFAIFADSLQPWDRKRNFNPAYMNLPYSTYGDRFSISFVHNKIYIHEEGDNLDIESRNNELGKYLDDYLLHASDFILKSLSEY